MKWGIAVALMLLPAAARAQSFEVGGGFAWTAGYGLGSAAANETRNPSTGSGPLTLFQTDSRIANAAGIDVRAGVHVTPRLFAAAAFESGRPTLRTRVTSDFEGAPDTIAETTVASYLICGDIEYRVTSRPWALFAIGGAGQFRDVPDRGDVLTAGEVHAGGGVRHALTHGRHPFGLRGDLVASYRTRTLEFDRGHVGTRATVGLTFRF